MTRTLSELDMERRMRRGSEKSPVKGRWDGGFSILVFKDDPSPYIMAFDFHGREKGRLDLTALTLPRCFDSSDGTCTFVDQASGGTYQAGMGYDHTTIRIDCMDNDRAAFWCEIPARFILA